VKSTKNITVKNDQCASVCYNASVLLFVLSTNTTLLYLPAGEKVIEEKQHQNYLINALHGKVECHELTYGSQSCLHTAPKLCRDENHRKTNADKNAWTTGHFSPINNRQLLFCCILQNNKNLNVDNEHIQK